MTDPDAAPVPIFSYKPALLRRAEPWRIDGTMLRGPNRSLDLTTVTGCVLADMGLKRGGLIRRLDLLHHEGKFSLSVTGMGPSEEVHKHLDLVVAIFARLSQLNPELQVTFGEGGGIRWTMFLIGAAALAFTAVLVGAVLSGSGRSTPEVFSSSAALGLFGLYVSVHYWPFRPRPALSVGTAGPLIEKLRA